MDGTEVSLFEKYFEDPEEVGGETGTISERNRRLLELVSENGVTSSIDKLLHQGANLLALNDDGNTALHIASMNGFAELTHHLVKHFKKQGFDWAKTFNRRGKTAMEVSKNRLTKRVFFQDHFQKLFECAKNDQVNILEEVASQLRRFNMLESSHPIMILHVAAENGASKVVNYMLDVYRVPVDSTTGVRRTALHYAVAGNRYEIIRLLLERGANTNVKDCRGRTPLEETNNRMIHRLVARVKAMREDSSHSERLVGSFRDFFSWSSSLVDSVFVLGFEIDSENLDPATAIKGSTILDAVSREGYKATSMDKHVVFCKEAIRNFLYSAQKESFATQRLMNMDYSFTERGSFVLLKRTKSAAANESATASQNASQNRENLSSNTLDKSEDEFGDAPLLSLPSRRKSSGRLKQTSQEGEDSPEILAPHVLPLQGVVEVNEDYSDSDSEEGDNSKGSSTLFLGKRVTVSSPSRRLQQGLNHIKTGGTRRASFCDRLHISMNLFRPWFYPFVVTNENGLRSYCSIICFLQLDEDEKVEGRCVCLLSQVPALTLHRDLLFDMFAVGMEYLKDAQNRGVCIDSMLDACIGKEIGRPGEKGISIDVGTRVLSFSRPPPLSFPVTDEMCFDALFTCLSPENIAMLVSALLTEFPVLLISEYPQLLTLASQGLLALLFPFEWYHPYIPILPEGLVDVVEAPFPFLVGLHSSYLELVSAERISSILVVNLDRGSVVSPINPDNYDTEAQADLPMLPMQFQEMISYAIYEALPPSRLRPAPPLLTNILACPGRKAVFDEEEEVSLQDESFTSMNDSFLDGLSVLSDVGSEKTSKRKSFASSTFKTCRSMREDSSSGHASAYGITGIRLACLRVIISLLGKYSRSHFASEQLSSFIGKQEKDLQPFLHAFFATQLWAAFAQEHFEGARNEQRDLELQFFFSMMDQELGSERLIVKEAFLYVHENAEPSSRIVSTLRRGDKVTLIDRMVATGKQVWYRFREYRGWCLCKPTDVVLDESAESISMNEMHFSNSQVYPLVQHPYQEAFDHDQLFRRVKFNQGFPRFGD